MITKRALILSVFTVVVQGHSNLQSLPALNLKSLADNVPSVVSSDQDKAICLVAGAAIFGLAAYLCSQGSVTKGSVKTEHDSVPKAPIVKRTKPIIHPNRALVANQPCVAQLSSSPKYIASELPFCFPISSSINIKNQLSFWAPAMHRVIYDKLKLLPPQGWDSEKSKEKVNLLTAAPFYNQILAPRETLGRHSIFPVLIKKEIDNSNLSKLYSFSGDIVPKPSAHEICDVGTNYGGLRYLGRAPNISAFFDPKIEELIVFYSNFKEKSHLVDRIETYQVEACHFKKQRSINIKSTNTIFPSMADIKEAKIYSNKLFVDTFAGQANHFNIVKFKGFETTEWLV